MTTAARSSFLKLLRDGESHLHADFAQISDRARTFLMASVDDATGKVPLQDWQKVQKQLAALILAYFVASDGFGYSVTRGIVVPKSPYMRLLWAQVQAATQQAVNVDAAALLASLASARDVVAKLTNATVSPMIAFELLDDNGDVFANYTPQQDVRWQDNRTLEDRVLFAAATTRSRVNALVNQLLSEGKNAKEVADALRDYFNGTLQRTGFSNGAFDASRLLGSETVFAHERARLLSAAANPFTEMVDVVLSPSHVREDVCDSVAGNSPYLLKDAPILGLHAGCLCSYRFHVNGKTKAVIERIRGTERLNVRGSLSPGFAELLLRGQ